MDDLPLSWAQDIARLALSATTSSSDPFSTAKEPGLTDPKDPGKDPRFRKLVEAVLFSRQLILTYNGVLLVILLHFTIRHWGGKAILAKRRRERLASSRSKLRGSENEDTWSSSKSTIEGTGTPPDEITKKTADESSPLLAGQPLRRKSPGIWKPYRLFESWMNYQPSPIPIINKTLPPNSVSLFVISFFGLNAFYNLYRIPLEALYLFPFADRCGMLFVSNLPLLYLLSAKNQPIKLLTGYSYESLNIFHRRVGELICFEAFLHFLGMVFVWYGLLRRLGFSLTDFLFNRVVGLGLGAFIAYEVLYITSLGSFRARCYEIFLALHVFLQTAGLVLLFFHHRMSRPYVAVSLAIFVIDRIAFRMWLKSSTHPATLTVLEDGETMILSANWDIKHRSTNAPIPHSMKGGWKPNDHVFLTIPSLSRKYALQAHPFTIFSAAPSQAATQTLQPDESNPDTEHAWFSLLIRSQHSHGFSHALLTHAHTHPNPNIRIRLDGSYGSSHALDILCDSSTAIVVAGGSGIAVAYPLLWALLRPDVKVSDLEGGTTTQGKMQATRKVKLLWIVHSASHTAWLPEDKTKELQDWGLQVLIPGPTSEVGRPDVGAVLDGWIYEGRGGTGVVVSGPDGLVRDVRNACAAAIGEGANVRVQAEKFGWRKELHIA